MRKSPNVFLDDADFAQGIAKGVLASFRNVGQSCSARTRMLVPAARLAEVEALAADAAGSHQLSAMGWAGAFRWLQAFRHRPGI